MAGDTMEFAKPVIGTSVPAPATFAILSYQPNAVNTAEMRMRLIGYKGPGILKFQAQILIELAKAPAQWYR